jgi:hypothetical protein
VWLLPSKLAISPAPHQSHLLPYIPCCTCVSCVNITFAALQAAWGECL